jgi:antitoxin CptB
MTEPREHKIKRLIMRSMRRGIKEMDIILSAYSTDKLNDFSDVQLDLYDALLEENDHDLYQWVSGQGETPPQYLAMMTDIAAHVEVTNAK